MADRKSAFDVTWRSIAKIVVAVALVWAWLQLWQFVMVLAIAIVIAVALDPMAQRLERHGVPRGMAALLSVLAVAAVVVAMIAASWVSLTAQARLIAENLTRFYQKLQASFPFIDTLLPSGNDGVGQYALSVGRSTATAIGMFVVALVLTVYLLIEWKRTLEWLIAFVPPAHRAKARRTLTESQHTVYRYVVGNFVTSVITAVTTFVALLALKVPAALMLAIIAGLLDFIPVVGFLLSLGVTVLLAATVSMPAVIGVILFYIAFNAVENYIIMPRIYGHELELSNLAVLVAVAIGAQLGGVMGALLALPIAATYPTIERIWLQPHLSADTVERHDRLSA